MIASLTISDEVVIGFFSSVVVGMAGAIGVLWRRMVKCCDERSKRE